MIDVRMFMAVLAGVLFIGLSLIAIGLLRAAHRWLERGRPSGIVETGRSGQPQPPPLSNDPELAAFFRAVDRGYGLGPTSKAKPAAPAAPQPIRERPDVKQIREGVEPQPSFIRPDPVPLGQTPHVPLPGTPPPAARPQQGDDPNLQALSKVWHRLSERDRQELMWLARLKLELAE